MQHNMQVSIVGSGPSGMAAALLLARQGHSVTLVDRDPGPVPGTEWERVGVMQFHLPHTLRAPGRQLLEERLPDVYAALLDAGCVVDEHAPFPFLAGLHLRRAVYERVWWDCVSAEPGITRVTGHADEVLIEGGHVTALVVDGLTITADLVIDASGKAGKLAMSDRPEGEWVPSPTAYATRHYQLLPGAEAGPRTPGPGYFAQHDGFLELVFVQDARTFSTLIVRSTDDADLAMLRDEHAFETAMASLPGTSVWTDPSRSSAISPVRAGAGMINRHRPQASSVVGLLAIGDAAVTTNPTGARGLTTGLRTACHMAELVATQPPARWAPSLDAWCDTELRPWFDDHVAWDASIDARWHHRDIDPESSISWDLVGEAAAEHPEWMATLGPFFAMLAAPGSIDPLREQVRQQLRDGWRPAVLAGPTRDELARLISGEALVGVPS